MNETVEAYPLHWPLGYARTKAGRRIRSPFKQSMEKAQVFLRNQIGLMKATKLIVSSNVPVRGDGGLYVDWMSRKIDDPGVAIYFQLDDEPVSMCCDQYLTVWENVYALGKSVEALRAIDRYGTSEFISRAFRGFKAIPQQSSAKTWWEILEVQKDATPSLVRQAYLEKVKKTHPDNGGSAAEFDQVVQAYKQATNG